uniref:uncharacterized protein LOC117609058 n=1 Tax=Osmia lignaria TaxID=473952 RepID=UPI0014797E5D|nr:uncharacterized protein LOC117609058 [Osmia lignaria]
MHWRETAKKAMIVMKQTWGIGERRFKNNFERRMKIYRSLVKSVMMYAADIWGWSESERLEKLHTKYIKWVLGLDFNTPTYIVMDETKEDKIRIEAGRRAVRYEEKTRTKGINKLILECWKEVDTKCERKRSKWEEQRRQYYEEKGIEIKDVKGKCTGDLTLAENLSQLDRAEQCQTFYDRIVIGRYNGKYRGIREENRAYYLKEEYKGRDQSMIARFRCGNEERGNRYWKKKEDNVCRMCGLGEDTIEHLLKECREVERDNDLTR